MKMKKPGTGMNPKMERKSTMAGVSGKPSKPSSGTGNNSQKVGNNKNQTGPSIMKKPKKAY